MRPRNCPVSDRHWRIDDIPFASVERARAAGNVELFYLLASASFVEVTSDLCAPNLVESFHNDTEVSDWIEHHWQHEERQHDAALRCYVNHLRPNFDREHAYSRFYSEYSSRCAAKPLKPSRRSKWFPAAWSRPEPRPCTRCSAGFPPSLCDGPWPAVSKTTKCGTTKIYRYFLRYQERERVVQFVVLRTLWNRVSEINGEDAYLAFKHVFLECRPDRRFHDSDYKAYCRQWKMLARRYYPYERAVHTVLKPLQLNR